MTRPAMRELPSGTVTLVFTDIEGSTRLLRELGERYADVLAEHRRVVREAETRARVNPIDFDRAVAEGRLLGAEEAVALAIEPPTNAM